jgi:hypothetical protein
MKPVIHLHLVKRLRMCGAISPLLTRFHSVTYKGLACLIILGSESDEWMYWHFFTITVNYNSSHIELLLKAVCLANLSLSRTDLYCSRIQECTAFYNCHAAGIDVTMLNSSSVPLSCHGKAFVNIRCRGNKCLPSRCLANGHILSQQSGT